jgi:hypothetical protein
LFSTSYSQNLAEPAIEIFFATEGDPQTSTPYTLNITSKSVIFNSSSSGIFPITANFETSSHTPIANNNWDAGWNAVWSQDYDAPTFAFALYKFTLLNNKRFFYIDFRDNNYQGGYPNRPLGHHAVDIWIKYNYFQDKFYYSSVNSSTDFYEISNGEYLTVWNIKQQQTHQTHYFENYWSNSLSVLHQYNSIGKLTPLVVWGPKPNYSALGYLVYRSIGIKGQGLGSWYHIATITDPDQFTFSDNTIGESTWESGDKYVAYKITAFDDINESEPTNVTLITPHIELSVEQVYDPISMVPYLVWSPSETFSATGYNIYRSIVGIGQPPGTYSLIQTITDVSTTEWYDSPYDPATLPTSLSSTGEYIAYYKVVPYNGNGETYSSYVVQIPLSRFQTSITSAYNQDMLLTPLISWQPIQNFTNLSGYKIYLSLVNSGQPPGTYGHIATVGNNQYSYLDDDILVNGNKTAYYKVRAYSGSTHSDFSNRVNISVSGFYKKGNHIGNNLPENNTLFQNHPNPFNPITEIKYYLAKPDRVVITISNVLGQEVANLLDSYQSEGFHTLSYKAVGLTSGVYYYKMTTSNHVDSKKMLYLR